MPMLLSHGSLFQLQKAAQTVDLKCVGGLFVEARYPRWVALQGDKEENIQIFQVYLV